MGNGGTNLDASKPQRGVITLAPVIIEGDPKLKDRPEAPEEKPKPPSPDLLKKLTTAAKSLGIDVKSFLDEKGNLKPEHVEAAKKRVASQLEEQKKKITIPLEDKKAFMAVLPFLKDQTEFLLLSPEDQAKILKDAGYKNTGEFLNALNKDYASPNKKTAHFIQLKAREAEKEKKPAFAIARLYDTASSIDPESRQIRLSAARAKRVWAESESDPESRKLLLEESCTHLKVILKKDPDDLNALSQLKLTLKAAGSPEAAKELLGKDFQKRLWSDKGGVEAIKLRADIYTALGEENKAKRMSFDAQLVKAEELAKKDPAAAKELITSLEKDLPGIEALAQKGSDISKVYDLYRVSRFHKLAGNAEKLTQVEKEIRDRCEEIRGTLKVAEGAEPTEKQVNDARLLAGLTAKIGDDANLPKDLNTWKELVDSLPREAIPDKTRLDHYCLILQNWGEFRTKNQGLIQSDQQAVMHPDDITTQMREVGGRLLEVGNSSIHGDFTLGVLENVINRYVEHDEKKVGELLRASTLTSHVEKASKAEYQTEFNVESNPVAFQLYQSLRAQGIPAVAMDEDFSGEGAGRLSVDELYAFVNGRFHNPHVQDALKASKLPLPKNLKAEVEKKGFAKAMGDHCASEALRLKNAELKGKGEEGWAGVSKNSKEVAAFLTMATLFEPKNAERHQTLGNFYYHQKDFASAKKAWTAAAGIRSKDWKDIDQVRKSMTENTGPEHLIENLEKAKWLAQKGIGSKDFENSLKDMNAWKQLVINAPPELLNNAAKLDQFCQIYKGMAALKDEAAKLPPPKPDEDGSIPMDQKDKVRWEMSPVAGEINRLVEKMERERTGIATGQLPPESYQRMSYVSDLMVEVDLMDGPKAAAFQSFLSAEGLQTYAEKRSEIDGFLKKAEEEKDPKIKRALLLGAMSHYKDLGDIGRMQKLITEFEQTMPFDLENSTSAVRSTEVLEAYTALGMVLAGTGLHQQKLRVEKIATATATTLMGQIEEGSGNHLERLKGLVAAKNYFTSIHDENTSKALEKDILAAQSAIRLKLAIGVTDPQERVQMARALVEADQSMMGKVATDLQEAADDSEDLEKVRTGFNDNQMSNLRLWQAELKSAGEQIPLEARMEQNTAFLRTTLAYNALAQGSTPLIKQEDIDPLMTSGKEMVKGCLPGVMEEAFARLGAKSEEDKKILALATEDFNKLFDERFKNLNDPAAVHFLNSLSVPAIAQFAQEVGKGHRLKIEAEEVLAGIKAGTGDPAKMGEAFEKLEAASQIFAQNGATHRVKESMAPFVELASNTDLDPGLRCQLLMTAGKNFHFSGMKTEATEVFNELIALDNSKAPREVRDAAQLARAFKELNAEKPDVDKAVELLRGIPDNPMAKFMIENISGHQKLDRQMQLLFVMRTAMEGIGNRTDHPHDQQHIAQFLDEAQRLLVSGECSTAFEAFEKTRQLRQDLVPAIMANIYHTEINTLPPPNSSGHIPTSAYKLLKDFADPRLSDQQLGEAVLGFTNQLTHSDVRMHGTALRLCEQFKDDTHTGASFKSLKNSRIPEAVKIQGMGDTAKGIALANPVGAFLMITFGTSSSRELDSNMKLMATSVGPFAIAKGFSAVARFGFMSLAASRAMPTFLRGSAAFRAGGSFVVGQTSMAAGVVGGGLIVNSTLQYLETGRIDPIRWKQLRNEFFSMLIIFAFSGATGAMSQRLNQWATKRSSLSQVVTPKGGGPAVRQLNKGVGMGLGATAWVGNQLGNTVAEYVGEAVGVREKENVSFFLRFLGNAVMDLQMKQGDKLINVVTAGKVTKLEQKTHLKQLTLDLEPGVKKMGIDPKSPAGQAILGVLVNRASTSGEGTRNILKSLSEESAQKYKDLVKNQFKIQDPSSPEGQQLTALMFAYAHNKGEEAGKPLSPEALAKALEATQGGVEKILKNMGAEGEKYGALRQNLLLYALQSGLDPKNLSKLSEKAGSIASLEKAANKLLGDKADPERAQALVAEWMIWGLKTAEAKGEDLSIILESLPGSLEKIDGPLDRLLGKGGVDTEQGRLLKLALVQKALSLSESSGEFQKHLENLNKISPEVHGSLKNVVDGLLGRKGAHESEEGKQLLGFLFLKEVSFGGKPEEIPPRLVELEKAGPEIRASLETWAESILGKGAGETEGGRRLMGQLLLTQVAAAETPKDLISALERQAKNFKKFEKPLQSIAKGFFGSEGASSPEGKKFVSQLFMTAYRASAGNPKKFDAILKSFDQASPKILKALESIEIESEAPTFRQPGRAHLDPKNAKDRKVASEVLEGFLKSLASDPSIFLEQGLLLLKKPSTKIEVSTEEGGKPALKLVPEKTPTIFRVGPTEAPALLVKSPHEKPTWRVKDISTDGKKMTLEKVEDPSVTTEVLSPVAHPFQAGEGVELAGIGGGGSVSKALEKQGTESDSGVKAKQPQGQQPTPPPNPAADRANRPSSNKWIGQDTFGVPPNPAYNARTFEPFVRNQALRMVVGENGEIRFEKMKLGYTEKGRGKNHDPEKIWVEDKDFIGTKPEMGMKDLKSFFIGARAVIEAKKNKAAGEGNPVPELKAEDKAKLSEEFKSGTSVQARYNEAGKIEFQKVKIENGQVKVEPADVNAFEAYVDFAASSLVKQKDNFIENRLLFARDSVLNPSRRSVKNYDEMVSSVDEMVKQVVTLSDRSEAEAIKIGLMMADGVLDAYGLKGNAEVRNNLYRLVRESAKGAKTGFIEPPAKADADGEPIPLVKRKGEEEPIPLVKKKGDADGEPIPLVKKKGDADGEPIPLVKKKPKDEPLPAAARKAGISAPKKLNVVEMPKPPAEKPAAVEAEFGPSSLRVDKKVLDMSALPTELTPEAQAKAKAALTGLLTVIDRLNLNDPNHAVYKELAPQFLKSLMEGDPQLSNVAPKLRDRIRNLNEVAPYLKGQSPEKQKEILNGVLKGEIKGLHDPAMKEIVKDRLDQASKVLGSENGQVGEASKLIEKIEKNEKTLKSLEEMKQGDSGGATTLKDTLSIDKKRLRFLLNNLTPVLAPHTSLPVEKRGDLKKRAEALRDSDFNQFEPAQSKRSQALEEEMVHGTPITKAAAEDVHKAGMELQGLLKSIEALEGKVQRGEIKPAEAQEKLNAYYGLLESNVKAVEGWKGAAQKYKELRHTMRGFEDFYSQEYVHQQKGNPTKVPIGFDMPPLQRGDKPNLPYEGIYDSNSANPANQTLFEVSNVADRKALVEFIAQDAKTRFPEYQVSTEGNLVKIETPKGTFFARVEIAPEGKKAEVEGGDAQPATMRPPKGDDKATLKPPKGDDKPTLKPPRPNDAETMKPGKKGGDENTVNIPKPPKTGLEKVLDNPLLAAVGLGFLGALGGVEPAQAGVEGNAGPVETKPGDAWVKGEGFAVGLNTLTEGKRIVLSADGGPVVVNAAPNAKGSLSLQRGSRNYRLDALPGLEKGEIVITGKDGKGQERSVNLKPPLGVSLPPGEYKIKVNGKEMTLNLPPLSDTGSKATPLPASAPQGPGAELLVGKDNKTEFLGVQVSPQFEQGLRLFMGKENPEPFVDFAVEGAKVLLKERNFGRAEKKVAVEGFVENTEGKAGFDHVVDRHAPGSDKVGDKKAGTYAENVDIEMMGRETVKSFDRVSQSYDDQGRVIFIFQKDFRQEVGSTTKGASTKTNQVILSYDGKIISSFPIEPSAKGWVSRSELGASGKDFSKLFIEKGGSTEVAKRHEPFLPGSPEAQKNNLYLEGTPYGVVNQRTRAYFLEKAPNSNAQTPGTHQEEITILKKGKPVKVMATVAEMRFEQPVGVREGPNGEKIPLYVNRTYFIEGNIIGGHPIREFGEKGVAESVWNPAVRSVAAENAKAAGDKGNHPVPVQGKRSAAAFKGPQSGEVVEGKGGEGGGVKIEKLDVSAKGTLAEVKISSVPPQITLQGKEWKAKAEFHVTLLGFAQTKDIAAKLKQEKNLSNKQVDAILKEANEHAAQGLSLDVSLGKDYRVVEHEGNRSIIVGCEVKGSEAYYKRFKEFLKEKHGIDIEIEKPPFHVTLFTGENGKAIGIPTEKALSERSKPLTPAETVEVEGRMKAEKAPVVFRVGSGEAPALIVPSPNKEATWKVKSVSEDGKTLVLENVKDPSKTTQVKSPVEHPFKVGEGVEVAGVGGGGKGLSGQPEGAEARSPSQQKAWEEAVGILEGLGTKNRNQNQGDARWLGITLAPKLAPKDRLAMAQKIEEKLKSANPEERLTAVQALDGLISKLDAKDRLPFILKLQERLGDENAQVRQASVEALGKSARGLESKDLLDCALKIEERLEDKDATVRESAVSSLEGIFLQLDPKDRGPRLLKIQERLADENAATREKTLFVLGSLLPHLEAKDRLGVVLKIEERLTDENWNVRVTAMSAVGKSILLLNPSDRLDRVRKIEERLQDGDARVRDWAISGVRQMAPHLEKKDIPARLRKVAELLKDKDPLIQEKARDALGRTMDAFDPQGTEVARIFGPEFLEIYFNRQLSPLLKTGTTEDLPPRQPGPTPTQVALKLSESLDPAVPPLIREKALSALVYNLNPFIKDSGTRLILAEKVAPFLVDPNFKSGLKAVPSLEVLATGLNASDQLKFSRTLLSLWEKSPHAKLPVAEDPVFKSTKDFVSKMKDPQSLAELKLQVQEKTKSPDARIREAAKLLLEQIDRQLPPEGSADAKRFETHESRKALAKAIVEADASGLGSVDTAGVKAAKDYLAHGDNPPANADLSFVKAQSDYSYTLGGGKWGVLAFAREGQASPGASAWTVQSVKGGEITLKNEKGEVTTVNGLGKETHPFKEGDRVSLIPRIAGGAPGPKDVGSLSKKGEGWELKPDKGVTVVDGASGKEKSAENGSILLKNGDIAQRGGETPVKMMFKDGQWVEVSGPGAPLKGPAVKVDVDLLNPAPSQVVGAGTVELVKKQVVQEAEVQAERKVKEFAERAKVKPEHLEKLKGIEKLEDIDKSKNPEKFKDLNEAELESLREVFEFKQSLQTPKVENAYEITCTSGNRDQKMGEIAQQLLDTKAIKPPQELIFIVNEHNPQKSMNSVIVVRYKITASGKHEPTPLNALFKFDYFISEGKKGEPLIKIGWIKAGNVEEAKRMVKVHEGRVQEATKSLAEDPKDPARQRRLERETQKLNEAKEDLEGQEVFRAGASTNAFAAMRTYVAKFPGATVQTRGDNLVTAAGAGRSFPKAQFIEITDPQKFPVSERLDPKFVEALERNKVLTEAQAGELKKLLNEPVTPGFEGMQNVKIHNQFVRFVRENYAKNPKAALNEVDFVFKGIMRSGELRALKEGKDKENPHNRGDLWIEGYVPKEGKGEAPPAVEGKGESVPAAGKKEMVVEVQNTDGSWSAVPAEGLPFQLRQGRNSFHLTNTQAGDMGIKDPSAAREIGRGQSHKLASGDTEIAAGDKKYRVKVP